MNLRNLIACAERERADDPIVNDLIAALRDLAARYNRLWDEHESPLRKRLRERLIARRDALVAENAALRREREPVAQPDALALVAAAYRDAADWLLDMRAVDDDGNETTPEADVYVTLINSLPKRTPADAQAALAAIERAAYERGVQSALQHIRTWVELEAEDRGEADAEYPLERQCAPILALLTQEGR